MRSRWLHRPRVHVQSHEHERRAGWLELFYDLIFVAAFIQLGNGLSKHLDPSGFVAFAAAFTALWVSWSGFTYYMNRVEVDDSLHRLMVFGQMAAVGVLAFGATGLFEGDYHLFAYAFSVALLFVGLFNLRAHLQTQESRPWTTYWGSIFFVCAVFWLLAGFLEPPLAYVPMVLAGLLLLVSPLSPLHNRHIAEYPVDYEHLSERFGLLTLIVLGESFVKVLDAASEGGAAPLLNASVLLLITLSIWWIYFDDIAGSEIRGKRLTPILWWLGHLPLQLGITAAGVGIKKASTLEMSQAFPEKYRWLLCGALAMVLLATAMIDSVTERRQAELSDRARVGMRSFSGLLMQLLAPAGGGMAGSTFILLVTALLVAQVIFDLMMAPLEDTPMHELGATSTAVGARERIETGQAARLLRPVEDTVRRGTPSALRQDLYFYFMNGGWSRLLVGFAFAYVALNLLFAGLYVLDPQSVRPHDPLGFADAFFFSIQTMSTIGYGVMSPANQYGDMLVTIEAAVGILGAALATGLVFAKVSRPQANVLWSDCMVIHERNGVPTVVFRVGNIRGNEIVDATVRLTALLEEMTPEGHHMRRMIDLDLVRPSSPLFMLSWTVMHEITEASPLAGVDWSKPETRPLIAATLVGHDGTYGQTVFSRKTYDPGFILPGHRFVDILSELPDGRMLIDYEKFQQIRPV